MSFIFSKIIKDISNIEVLDYKPSGAEYDFLRPRGSITIDMDDKWNTPVILINFEVGVKMLFTSDLRIILREKIF